MTVNIPLSLLDQLHTLAVRAGDLIMDIYKTDFDVQTKGDDSPVTKADQLAEDLITQGILEIAGDHFPIIGEEAFSDGKAPELDGGPFWLVDPLDGTKEFISKNGEFTVNIALIDAGSPVLGVVHAPALGQTYLGSPHGAFADLDGNGPKQIHCRPAPAKGLTALVSRNHKTPETVTFLEDFKIAKEMSAGSSLKFCHVARGAADLYPRLGRTMEWDTAAGHAVLVAAGGSVTNLDGQPLMYGKPGLDNPHFVAKGVLGLAD
ncbi:MAG: 3'(2'),5'-bisphosphate nucleotidase [Rhodospirillaceae bacterium]|nr:MAG: 3'(2'),5'-bisphosphate nucleotidase [Rhodospirillaceae bacterium]